MTRHTPVCEACGCQQVATIAELIREHDAVAALVGQIQNALAGQRHQEVVASCRQILAVLAPHEVVEEKGLFAAMRHDFPEHVEALCSEHREIKKVLAEAAAGFPADPTWPERMLGAVRVLREHILKEEDGVFPAALVALDARQWERIEAVRARVLAQSREIPVSMMSRAMSPKASSDRAMSGSAMSGSEMSGSAMSGSVVSGSVLSGSAMSASGGDCA